MQNSNLHILHITDHIGEVAGGVPSVVRQLSQHLVSKNISNKIIHSIGSTDNLAIRIEDTYTLPPSKLGRFWSYSEDLKNKIINLSLNKREAQKIFHIHGVWAAPQYYAAKAADTLNMPSIFSAHGMLDPWLWNNQGIIKYLKKNIYWNLFASDSFQKATVIHAITPLERQYLFKLFPRNAIEIIPNSISIEENTQNKTRRKSIVFVGRIEKKKGVDILLHAFSNAKISKDWHIDIIGPFWSKKYQKEIYSLIELLNLSCRVTFHGTLFGKERDFYLDNAWVMVTPSHSEAIGLVNLEAASRYLPTITTPQTGLYDWEQGGGLLCEPNYTSLQKALENACSWTESEQMDRGRASRDLVIKNYSWQANLPKWIELYSSL